jgi:alpha-1,2-mannosyltransferase
MSIVGEAVPRRGHLLPGRLGTDRSAWILWACFALLVVLTRLDSVPSIENVFTIYREAGLRWLNGQDLYPAEFKFNYFPPSAVLFAAWSWLPFGLGGALWRIVNIAVFALGLRSLSNSGALTASSQRFFIATVVTVVLSGSAARYGQMTLAMAGLMMAAVAFAESGALWRAAVCAALAVALKPLAIVLLLLLAAVYPRLLWRMGVALAVSFLLPFLFQHSDYVWRQYAEVPAMLATRAHPNYGWQQNIFGLLDKLWWTATDAGQAVTNGAFALVVMFLCWRARRHAPAIGVALSIYGLASCYILLFGSGTERNTYAMLAPVIGLVAATAWDARDRHLLAFISSVIVIMLLSYTLQHAFPHTVLAMAKPAACVLLFAWLGWIVLRTPREANKPAARNASSP